MLDACMQTHLGEHGIAVGLLSKGKGQAGSTAKALTKAPQAATSRQSRGWQHESSIVLKHDAACHGTSNQKQNITSMLEKLQLLQQEGVVFASRV